MNEFVGACTRNVLGGKLGASLGAGSVLADAEE